MITKTMMITAALIVGVLTGSSAMASPAYPDVPNMPVIKDLPDPFVLPSGKRITMRNEWTERRLQIQDMLLHYEYGHLPPFPTNLKATRLSSSLVGAGTMQEDRILITSGLHNGVKFHLDLLIPQGKQGPFPVILTGDPGPTPIPDEVVRRGYILAQFDRTEIAPDDASRDKGVYPIYSEYDWGVLAAWAWGYSRAVDYLLTRPDVDAKRIAVAGHSRGGKAALLAGALDERIALTAPNESGTGGASPFRLPGKGSESIAKITGRFGYWFHPRLQEFVGHEGQMPFDQHFLMAMVAPRALYLNAAMEDPYSNPLSTQQAYLAAKQVYAFLGKSERIGWRSHEGGHSFDADDWRALLDFADKQFFLRSVQTQFNNLPFPSAAPPFSWKAPQ